MKIRFILFILALLFVVNVSSKEIYVYSDSVKADTLQVLDLDSALQSLEKDTTVALKDSSALKTQENILAVTKRIEEINRRLETLKTDSVNTKTDTTNVLAKVEKPATIPAEENKAAPDSVKPEDKSIENVKVVQSSVPDATALKDSVASTKKTVDFIPKNGKSAPVELPLKDVINNLIAQIENDSIPKRTVEALQNSKITTYEDSLIYMTNPFFIDLIYMGKSLPLNFSKSSGIFNELYFGTKAKKLDQFQPGVLKRIQFNDSTSLASLNKIRRDARNYINRTSADLYTANIFDLPNASENKFRFIPSRKMNKVNFVDESLTLRMGSKLEVEKPKANPWQKKANALVQFSQNYVSSNWYQGGLSSMSILNTLSGSLNYTGEKIQWSNTGEWRLGMMSMFNPEDSTYSGKMYTNDDVFKIESKFGVKAIGSWSYTALLNFSTQLFDNKKAYNSEELKAKFLTPIRFNFGVGMSYNYKQILSVTLAPVSYKLIYLTDSTSTIINPNLFGIEKGERKLSEIGSSLNTQLKWKPFPELELNSTLKFYTNYEKVEIDWEIIANFTVNRFLSTRLILNPRFDNTVILEGTEKAKIQFKELLSFGFNFHF